MDHSILIVNKEREEKEYNTCQKEKESKYNREEIGERERKKLMILYTRYSLSA